MAIIKPSALVSVISGKVGGSTLVNGAQGNYLKNNGNYKKTASIRQSKQRAISAAALQHWRSLSLAEKQKFINLVGQFKYVNRVGDIKNYNGFQIFMLQQQNALLYKGLYLSAAYPKYSFKTLSANVNTFLGGTVFVDCPSMNPDTDLIVLATQQSSSPSGTPYSRLKQITVIDATSANAGVDVTSDYESIFGPINTDYQIFFAFRQLASSQFQTTDYFSPQWVHFP